LLHGCRTRCRDSGHAPHAAAFEIGNSLTLSALHSASTDDSRGAPLAAGIAEMKTATRLQFSGLTKAIARATGWALVTMAVGLMLVILFGSPLAASSPSSNDLPGTSHKTKSGPWGSRPVSVRV
jgi:hypothetical protein